MQPCYPQFNLPTGGQRGVGGADHGFWSLKECRGGDGGERGGWCLFPQLDSLTRDEALLVCFLVIMKQALMAVVS